MTGLTTDLHYELPDLGRSKLVCFEVSPTGDLGVILWREPMYRTNAPVGESIVFHLNEGRYESGTMHRLLTGTFHANDNLRWPAILLSSCLSMLLLSSMQPL